ncbi:hypothetical protein TCAL_16001 [Tigriopus californicus]|uniref:Uncharacterized protein n=1 Tax=Tigriopus californicus TaxID=6832 RepID=A0A553PG16_TIGCA|nr:hypothetical protein TCAL_16001 [Tigriopus californicus]
MEVRRRPVSLHVDSDGMVNPSPRRIAFESPQFKNRQASQPSSLDLETMLKFRRRPIDLTVQDRQPTDKSFEAVAKWKGDIDKKCLLPDGRRIPTILIGNKRDVARDKCLPCDLTISEFATEKGFDALRILVKYIMAMDTWNRPLADPDEQDVFQPQKTIRLEEDMVDGNPTVPSSSSDRDQSTNVKGCACSLL